NGKELWKAVFPKLTSRNLWNYIIYTNNGFLVFCQKDWTLNAYRVIQTKLKKNITIKEHKTYSDFYNISQNNIEIRYSKKISKETVSEERLFELRNGDYAEKEIVLSNEITGICNEYSRTLSTNEFGTRKEKTVFELDTQGFEQVLTQLCLFCNSDSQKIAANILEKTKNKTFIKVLLNGIKQNGYDPEGLILNALEKQASVTDYKDNGVISLICDAVYSICVFMGRPAFNQRGKELLKNFLYPSYDAKSRSYARDTLKKIIALDL
ncbi:MAG: hypothetical protein HUJ68_08220, partial [Clostridia bacterium]|nr:hypothetical protein [Clostridia bacterium]